MSFSIAVAGKGGTGKTSITSLIIRYLLKNGRGPVLAVDADANANLGESLGLTVRLEDWDVSTDGAVNVLDMIRVGQHWDEAGLEGWIREDVNEDGTVNVLDMILIGQHWTG